MAGITTDNFIITNPGLAGVRLLFGTGSNQGKVQGIIANTTDCNQNNYAAEFESLEVFNIFSTPFPIASRQAKTNHYYFDRSWTILTNNNYLLTIFLQQAFLNRTISNNCNTS